MTIMELSRPLAEKKARMKMLAHLMDSLTVFEIFAGREMGNFSHDETAAFGDAIDALDHFIKLATAKT